MWIVSELTLDQPSMKFHSGRVDLVRLIRFLAVKLIYSDLNSKFDMSVTFTVNYSFNGR
jgi:hypothetical protein